MATLRFVERARTLVGKHFLLLCTLLWLAACAAGMGILFEYENTPGPGTVVPEIWPSKSQLPHGSVVPTLLVFAHPKCPCTRATIGELAVLMAHCQKRVEAYVVFIQPEGFGTAWVHTDLWQSAQAIPGVGVREDKQGKEASLFHVTTSGHALLYDEHGKLLFSGGITAGRGHEGDNEGGSDLLELLRHEIRPGQKTPAFGCSLFAEDSQAKSNEKASTR